MKLIEVRIKGSDHAALRLLADMRESTVTALVSNLVDGYLRDYDISKTPLQMRSDGTCDRRLMFAPSDSLAERIAMWRRATGAKVAPLVRALISAEVDRNGREIHDYFQSIASSYLP